MKSTFNVLEFFRNFERLLEDMRYKEIESNYEMSQKMPSLTMDIMLLKNTRDVYKPLIFNLVREEYEKSCNLVFTGCTQNLQLVEYEVCFFGDTKQHKVIFLTLKIKVWCVVVYFSSLLVSFAVMLFEYLII